MPELRPPLGPHVQHHQLIPSIFLGSRSPFATWATHVPFLGHAFSITNIPPLQVPVVFAIRQLGHSRCHVLFLGHTFSTRSVSPTPRRFRPHFSSRSCVRHSPLEPPGPRCHAPFLGVALAAHTRAPSYSVMSSS